MGQFNISLPGNRTGDVRWGNVTKKDILLNLLPWRKMNQEEKTGYIIKVEPAAGNKREFRLFKTKEGRWSLDADGRVKLAGETVLAIKKAIEEHESFNQPNLPQ